jgi:hypothetical protein
MRRLRLVKVAVQPVFVIDDGENIEEIEHPVTVIPAAEWPTYSGERFPREISAWQARLDQEDGLKPYPNGRREEEGQPIENRPSDKMDGPRMT